MDMTCTNHPDVAGSIVRCSRCLRPFCNDCLVHLGGRPFCADCKVEQVRDVHSGVVLEQIALATIGRRFAALLIDWMIVGMPVMIVVFIVVFGSFTRGGAKSYPPGFRFIGFIQIPIMILYEGLMLSARSQTVGKMAMNLRVVRPDGSPISTRQAWGRASIRALMASFLSLIDYLPALFTSQKTALHDMAAKTRVITLG